MKIKIITDWNEVKECSIDGVWGKRLYGGHRRVFEFDDFVIKFDAKRSGDIGKQNKRELETYKLIAPEDRQYFAKILGSGKVDGRLYIIQEKVNSQNPHKPTAKQIRTFEELRDKYKFEDVFVDDEGGRWHHNCAVVRGKSIKIYDLGFEKDLMKRSKKKQKQGRLF